MSHYKLSDICKEISLRVNNPSTSEYDKFVGLEHYISGDVLIKNYGSTNNIVSAMKAFQIGDVLVARRNVYLKRASQVNFDGITSGDSIVLRPTDKKLSKLLPFILNTDHFWDYADQYSDGTMSKRLSPKTLMNYEFDLPAEEKLNILADILWAANNTREKYRILLQKTDELVKSRFVEMFGDIATEKYKYSTRKLGDIAKVGSSHRVFTTEFVEDGIPFYRGTEIGLLANGVRPTDTYFISEEHYNRLACDDSKPLVGDLLLPSICDKGQVWMVDNDKPFYYKDGRVLCISADRTLMNTKYLEYYMRLKTEIEYPKLGSGSTFAEFKIFLLKDIDVVIPPRELQDNYAAFVQQVDKSKFVLKKAIEDIDKVIKALIQQDLNE